MRDIFARRLFVLSLLAFFAQPLVAMPPAGQDGGLTTRNPLDEIRDELVEVLDAADAPFDDEQAAAIVLVLEESRRASEQLFGDVMNFSGGPPRGDDVERAMAGIEWMNEDFRQRVREYLDPEQLEVWDAWVSAGTSENDPDSGIARTSEQVQQIRINNNAFTAENGNGGSFGSSSGSGVQAQIIQRGGTGGWHGNSQLQFRDEALNARNPFADNKPSYQQRNINGSISGPLIANRLTVGGNFGHSKSDSPGTVNAETPDGPVQFGFTRNQSSRNGGVNGILQISRNQSAHFNARRNSNTSENQNVGGTNLPERAVDFSFTNENYSIRHVWFQSERLVQDISFNVSSNSDRADPHTEAVSIDVPGSFGGGGSSRSSSQSLNHQFRALWIYTGDLFAIRTGGSAIRRYIDRTNENNFQGTFTFPNLEAFVNQEPSLYTVTVGDPSLAYAQVEWNMFFQMEQSLGSRLTVFYGLRYERQTDLDDHNNVDPRVGMAYALGNSSVIRAGFGVFHSRVQNGIEYDVLRLDGERQSEIVITDPSYPDPFVSGDVTIVPPVSRRVRADDLVAPYQINTSVQFERSLPANLFVTASFDYRRGYHRLRSRNLNAPFPGETERPDPSEGNVWRLESTGINSYKAFRVGMRQRFSIFNVNADYTYDVDASDTVGTFGAPTNNYDLRADWASVAGHQFSTRINSRLPLDVYLTTNVSYRSGNPYTITTGLDDNGDGVLNDRPTGISRNSERGPYRHNVSFNISKAFPLGNGDAGGANMSLYANMNNAFNRTNLSTPISNLSSSRFGQYVNASNPREITVGMRFSF